MTGAAAAALAGLALAGAGTGVSMSAQAAARDEAERKTRQELLRQKGFQQKGQEEFAASLGKSGSDVAKKQIDQGTEAVTAAQQQAGAVPISASQATSVDSQPQNVHQQAENNYVSQQGNARAQLGGYSDWQLDQWIKNVRAQQQLSQIGNFAHGSQNVLPFELQSAMHSQDDMQAAGTGLGALGALVGGLGAAGLFGAGTAASTAGTAGSSLLSSMPATYWQNYPAQYPPGQTSYKVGAFNNRTPTYNQFGPQQ